MDWEKQITISGGDGPRAIGKKNLVLALREFFLSEGLELGGEFPSGPWAP